MHAHTHTHTHLTIDPVPIKLGVPSHTHASARVFCLKRVVPKPKLQTMPSSWQWIDKLLGKLYCDDPKVGFIFNL